MSDRLEIAFVGPTAASDRRGTSGIPYYMARTLNSMVGNVADIGPIPTPQAPLLRRIPWKIESVLTGRRYRWSTDGACLRWRAKVLLQRMTQSRYDLLFNCMEGWSLAYYEGTVPACVFTDATFVQRQAMGWYKSSLNLPARSMRECIEQERNVYRRSALVCVSSRWAAGSIINDYDVDPNRVLVAPFGANLDDNEIPSREEAITGPRESAICRLLFLGVDWERKGGNVAVETVKLLNAGGCRTELIVAGCSPAPPLPDSVRLEGFLDKNSPLERTRILELLRSSHFLVFPTRSEAFGIVICEAAACGLPSVAAGIGAIPEILAGDEGGLALPQESPAIAYAEAIAAVWDDPARYRKMRAESRNAFESRFNWGQWGETMRKPLSGLCESPHTR